jgi:hypothetical protein
MPADTREQEHEHELSLGVTRLQALDRLGELCAAAAAVLCCRM